MEERDMAGNAIMSAQNHGALPPCSFWVTPDAILLQLLLSTNGGRYRRYRGYLPLFPPQRHLSSEHNDSCKETPCLPSVRKGTNPLQHPPTLSCRHLPGPLKPLFNTHLVHLLDALHALVVAVHRRAALAHVPPRCFVMRLQLQNLVEHLTRLLQLLHPLKGVPVRHARLLVLQA